MSRPFNGSHSLSFFTGDNSRVLGWQLKNNVRVIEKHETVWHINLI